MRGYHFYPHVNISFLFCYLNLTYMKIGWTVFSNLWQLVKIFEKYSETFIWPSNTFWQISSEIFRMWSEIFIKSPKTLLCIVKILCNKRKITSTGHLEIWNFSSHVENKINFVSSRGHVISPTSSTNSPRLLTFPTAIKGVLITGVNDVEPGAIGTVSCISYLCLCWRKPKWALTIDSPFIRSCISVFAVTSSGKCTWWPAKIQSYIR